AGGASHVGFIFFAKSPRFVDPAEAGRLRQAAIGKAKAVAVTVDADDALLDEIVARMQPDMLQLHGSETPVQVAELKTRYGLPVMKVLSVSEAADLERIKPYVGVADRLMFDAKPPKGSQLPGGNGVAFDWRILAGLDAGLDYMLSGGLNAANVGDALRLANPPGIDISSGVESAPGVKDPALIEQFFRAVRAARDDRAA
ncbi:MAG: phosphoribosylanthranilate isomerase, partial [Mesorhizobium sp.]